LHIIYTKKNCPRCEQLKAFIKFEYTTVDVEEDKDAYDELISNGFRSVPQLKKDGLFISMEEFHFD
jgi:glutaredoxin